MPGRPGRSKGCINCQRRKIGCDRAKPGCGRCLKLGERCEGYSAISFIAFEPARSKPIKEATPTTPEEQRQPIDLVPNGHPFSYHVGEVGFPPAPSMLPMRQEIFITYTRHFMLKGTGDHFPVLNLVDAFESSNVLYRASMTALSTSFFGITQGRIDLIRKGTKLYGNSLKDINDTLINRANVVSTDLLASIVCLGLFEFMHPTSDTGWIHHFNGLARLFEMWGPEACSTKPIGVFFEHVRPIMIFAAMRSCRPSFLAQTEWKTIPWQGRQFQKEPIELLFDIMADLPSYVHVQEKIRTMSEDPPHLKRGMISSHASKLRMSIAALDQWLVMFGKTYGKYREELPCLTIPLNSTGNLVGWDSNYCYKTLAIANAICFHNATRIFVLLMLIADASPNGSPGEGAVFTDIENMRASALDICKSADFHFLHFQDSAGGFFLMFPMLMAMRAFAKLEMWSEVKWTQDQFAVIGTKNKVSWQIAGSYVKS